MKLNLSGLNLKENEKKSKAEKTNSFSVWPHKTPLSIVGAWRDKLDYVLHWLNVFCINFDQNKVKRVTCQGNLQSEVFSNELSGNWEKRMYK